MGIKSKPNAYVYLKIIFGLFFTLSAFYISQETLSRRSQKNKSKTAPRNQTALSEKKTQEKCSSKGWIEVKNVDNNKCLMVFEAFPKKLMHLIYSNQWEPQTAGASRSNLLLTLKSSKNGDPKENTIHIIPMLFHSQGFSLKNYRNLMASYEQSQPNPIIPIELEIKEETSLSINDLDALLLKGVINNLPHEYYLLKKEDYDSIMLFVIEINPPSSQATEFIKSFKLIDNEVAE